MSWDGELQVQSNARRFASTREVWTRQAINSVLAGLEEALDQIAALRRAGDLTRAEALTLSVAAVERRESALTVLDARLWAVSA